MTKGKKTTSRRTKQATRKRTPKAAKKAAKRSSKKWSASVTAHSDALDLEGKVFKQTPSQIARSLKRSAERSRRRKSSPNQSAMSMLTFYVNRAGKNLSTARRKKLQAAKSKLREEFGRTA